jgi:peptide/nickel transport system substrate-binding protein
MSRYQSTYRSCLNKFILLICMVFIIAQAPFVTGTPAAVEAAGSPTRLDGDATSTAMVDPLPREETLYFNGQQWGPVTCWNPYSSNCNNALAIAQQDNARVIMFETPYMYNMLDGQQYPLLADGPWSWNAEMTEITFDINPAAHWSDGTPVTAADVAYTWATNIKYETMAGVAYRDFIDSVEADGQYTVRIMAKLDEADNAINPLMVVSFLSSNYVIQKAWTQILEDRVDEDPAAFIADPGEDVVWSGPYTRFYADDQIVVYVRDDNYWGQDASMWGKLPAPKYLAHVIFADNNAGLAAFMAGEVDVSQQYIANVQDLWLVEGLPVSTYVDEAPYGIAASLPTAFFNLNIESLNNLAIRKAIAIAVDYEAVIANAMTNQSPTFTQVPRSVMNPTPYEQALYDHEDLASLQWVGDDIAGANAILDAAGIVDTNMDGWREYDGENLVYNAVCPNGWSDWQAAIEIVAAAGADIGIDIQPYFPEWSDYQNVFTDGNQTEYDIFMVWTVGAGPISPWGRVRQLMSSEFAGTTGNWNGNWGGYVNPAIDAIITAIPAETDHDTLVDLYTEATRIYLTDIPSFTLMYRPQSFHTVNESIWTNFPHEGDGSSPAVPPLDLTDGYSVAGLYNLTLVPHHIFLPLLQK